MNYAADLISVLFNGLAEIRERLCAKEAPREDT